MPTADLSRVTQVLTETLRLNITQRIDPSLVGVLNVASLPPERAEGEANTVNLYMYHLAEEEQFRNLPGNRSDLRPAATKPLTLTLYYILTTHHSVQSAFDTITEQRLMGYALKTFHDFAVIDDETNIGGTFLLPQDLRADDNRLEIAMRRLEPDEAITYWSAEQASTTRLSAYLDVRYALLEPEPPQRLPGVVLNLGAFIVDIASPQLAATRSVLEFTLPAIAGSGPQTLESSPARVGPPVPASPQGHVLTLLGSGLATGRSRTVLLDNPRWRARAPNLPQAPIDVSLPGNAGWSVAARAGELDVTMDVTLDAVLPDGATVTLPVEPGVYAASLRIVKDSAIQFGRVKEIVDRSNAISFAVIPRVVGVAVVDAATRRIRISLAPTIDLTPPIGPGLPGPLDILVVVDGAAYARHDPAAPGGAFDVGEFEPSGAQVDVRLTFDLATPGTYPVRVVVEGAESQPFWFEAP